MAEPVAARPATADPAGITPARNGAPARTAPGRGSALRRYLAVRLAGAVFVVWAAYTLSFVILYLVPGDPVEMMVSSGGVISVTAEQIAQLRAEYGLDRSPAAQYGTNLWHALHLDFGESLRSGQSAVDIIGGALPSTATLTAAALALAVLAGWGLALCATVTRIRWLPRVLLALPAIGVAVPSFWVGLLLLQALSFRLHLFPKPRVVRILSPPRLTGLLCVVASSGPSMRNCMLPPDFVRLAARLQV